MQQVPGHTIFRHSTDVSLGPSEKITWQFNECNEPPLSLWSLKSPCPQGLGQYKGLILVCSRGHCKHGPLQLTEHVQGRCCSSCRLRDLGRQMGMNMEQKMVEKFRSRPGQQKPTQDLLQLTWSSREDLMMGNMKSLTRCVSQTKCQNWNMYEKNKKNSWIWSKHQYIRAESPATSSGLWSKFFQRNKLKWKTEKTQEQLAMIHCKIWPWKAVVKRLI